jgi:hypothetical protein
MKITGCSGSVRLGFFLIGIIVAMFWAGGQGIYSAISNRNPTVMSYADYVKSKPNSTWLSLTNCVLDLSDSAYRTVGVTKKPLELYVPLHAKGSSNDTVQVVLATRSPELIKTIMEMETLGSRAAAEEWEAKNHDRLFPKRDVSGLIRYGIDLKSYERTKLMGIQANLAKDFIILNEGQKPDLGKSLAFLATGVMAVAGCGLYLKANRQISTDEI